MKKDKLIITDNNFVFLNHCYGYIINNTFSISTKIETRVHEIEDYYFDNEYGNYPMLMIEVKDSIFTLRIIVDPKDSGIRIFAGTTPWDILFTTKSDFNKFKKLIENNCERNGKTDANQ